MYKTSKYYSYIFYADRNVRPCTILGYTLTTFPKSHKTLMHNQSNRNLWHNCKRNTKQMKQNLHLIVSRRTLQFRMNHNCEQAIMELTSKILHAKEQGEQSVGIFFDLSKAFDTLNHTVLLSKLE